jgi:Na+/H+ antiporter NhaB
MAYEVKDNTTSIALGCVAVVIGIAILFKGIHHKMDSLKN